LGARAVAVTGTLKFAAPPLPVDEGALTGLRAAAGDRPLWLAASTHPGEEDVVLAAHRALAETRPRLLTVIAPRHPARGPAIAAQARAAGLNAALRSQDEPLTDATAIYIADTIGELGIFFRLAPIAFVGGSLIAHGGQNPIEPIRLGCAVLHGPSMHNFTEVTEALAAVDALRTVDDAQDLATTVAALLDAPDTARALAAAQGAVIDAKADALDIVLDALTPLLPQAEAR
jgi:3-deoxy-D-manno-octulosonic-acid transferase